MALCRYIFPWSLKLSLSLVIVSELSPRVQFPGKGNSIVSSIFSMIGELTCNCWIFPMIDGSDFWVSFDYYSRSWKSFYDVGIWFHIVIMLLSLVVISNVLDRACPGFLDCGSDLDSHEYGLDVLDLPYYYNLILISCLLIFELDVGFVLLDSWVMRRFTWIFTDVINWSSLLCFFFSFESILWFHSRTIWSNSLISQLHIFHCRVHNANDLLRSLTTVYVES